MHRCTSCPGPVLPSYPAGARLVSRARLAGATGGREAAPARAISDEPVRPAAVGSARPRRSAVAAGSAERAYSSRARRGTARIAAASPGRDDGLVEPVRVDRVVDVVHRIELLRPDGEGRGPGDRRRRVARSRGRAGRSPSASRTPRRSPAGCGSGRRARRAGPNRRGSRRRAPRPRRGSRSAAAPRPAARRRPRSSRSASPPTGDRREDGRRPRRGPARSGRAPRTRRGRSRARRSGTRRGPGRSAAASTSAAGRPVRPRRTGPGTATVHDVVRRPSLDRPPASSSVSRLTSAMPSVGRGLAVEPDRARALGVEHDQGDRRARSSSSAAWVRASSSWCRTSALIPRAPHLQSYASAAPSRSTVTSYGWISARTPSKRIRRSRRTVPAGARVVPAAAR